MPIELAPDARSRSIESIRRFFKEELDQDIGDLKASSVLEFVLREIAPTVHNAAIELTQTYLRDRLVDLEAVASEQEFAYWPNGSRRISRGPGAA